MFQNLISFEGNIEDLLPAGGFIGGTLDANYLFNDCRYMTRYCPIRSILE